MRLSVTCGRCSKWRYNASVDLRKFEKYLWNHGGVVFSEDETEIRYYHEGHNAYAAFSKERTVNPETVHAVCWTLGIPTPPDVLAQLKSAPVSRPVTRRKVRE